MKKRTSIREQLSAAAGPAAAAVDVPVCASAREFLTRHARVKVGSRYLPYVLDNLRPALQLATDLLDDIIAKRRPDCRIKIKGGAQWGKTVWATNIMSYLLGVRFLGVGYYLPDIELVQGVVDSKFRPDVVDQIPWFAKLLRIGSTINESGKAVQRKGAIMATDGEHVALGYFLGTNRVPTTYTHDVQIVDERDDINERNEKFLDGRLTSSDLRLRIDIGTARYDAAGMDAEFEDSTQHVAVLDCPGCGAEISPEDEWPGICRVQMGGACSASDPALTLAGDFKVRSGMKADPNAGATVAVHKPGNRYYFACPHCGSALDRDAVRYQARRPEMAAMGKYGIEVSQIATPAIGLMQIVAAWTDAVRDADKMVAFRCDRWARPRSQAQGLSAGVIERSRALQPYAMTAAPAPGATAPRFAGLDTGDKLWLCVREIESAARKRISWAEQLSPSTARIRVPELFTTLGLSCLFIDIGNERQLARDLVMILNGIMTASAVSEDQCAGRITWNKDLLWDGEKKEWRGLKAAAVEFSGKPGSGIVHEIRRTQEGLAYPVIRANRDETVQRVVDEFLCYDDGLVHVVDGKLRTEPIMLMPDNGPGCNAIVPILEKHLLSGSRKVRNRDNTLSFIDGVENHLLLANAYSGLAEAVLGGAGKAPHQKFVFDRVERNDGSEKWGGI